MNYFVMMICLFFPNSFGCFFSMGFSLLWCLNNRIQLKSFMCILLWLLVFWGSVIYSLCFIIIFQPVLNVGSGFCLFVWQLLWLCEINPQKIKFTLCSPGVCGEKNSEKKELIPQFFVVVDSRCFQFVDGEEKALIFLFIDQTF